MMLAELMEEAGLPKGVLQVVNGDKVAVDAMLENPTIQSIGFVGSTPIAEYIYGKGCANGKRVQCFGGAKNHMIVMPDADMDLAADALVGAGYGAAGERCMAISVAVPVGDETADRLIEKLVPRIERLQVGPYTAGDEIDYGPVVTSTAKENILGLVESGVNQGAKLVVDGRGFSLQVSNYTDYEIASLQNKTREVLIQPMRGIIYDRNGEIIVNNTPSYNLITKPSQIKDLESHFNKISMIISLSEEDITYARENFNRKARLNRELILKKNLTLEEIARFESRKYSFL